ncbi:MAG: TlpA family protein disulfide reductase [Desulfatiglans sp.]|jgi:peroxiredoxin|nr:TlpA family protein disulfide reductase [Desulfatiglans sp.]
MRFKLIALCVTLLTIFMAFTFSGCSKDNEKAEVKTIDAPDFTLTAMTGEDITLSQYRGKVVLLDFWATWCGPCMLSIPELVRLQEKYRDKGLVVLGVSVDTLSQADDGQILKFMRTFGINYPVMRDDGTVSGTYYGDSPAAIPTMHIINREGKIIKTISGFTQGEVPNIVETLLK